LKPAIALFLEILMAAIFAPLLWASGFRRRVIRRNLQLMRWRRDPFLRWRLTFHAARDLTALFLTSPPRYRIHPRSRMNLAAMRKGPSILLTAHFHNWEWLGSALRREGVPILAAAKPLRAAWAEQWLLHLRARIGVPTVSGAVPRAAIRHLKLGGCFAFLWDQHAPGSEYSGEFFDTPARMNPLPLFLLARCPCPVYFGILLPGGNVRLLSLLSRFEEYREEQLIRRYHRVLEILVRARPEFWYGFFHARFKNIAFYPGHRNAGISSGVFARSNPALP
jgi:lauroyl/myristoyl acyltransferase